MYSPGWDSDNGTWGAGFTWWAREWRRSDNGPVGEPSTQREHPGRGGNKEIEGLPLTVRANLRFRAGLGPWRGKEGSDSSTPRRLPPPTLSRAQHKGLGSLRWEKYPRTYTFLTSPGIVPRATLPPLNAPSTVPLMSPCNLEGGGERKLDGRKENVNEKIKRTQKGMRCIHCGPNRKISLIIRSSLGEPSLPPKGYPHS